MILIEIFKSIILGIVEGLTEWLPISSTGHMILVNEFLKQNTSPAFNEMFLVVIQLGAILAVVVLFFKKLNPFTTRGFIKKETGVLWLKIFVACIPAAIIGFLFNDQINAIFYNYQTVAVTLVLYGVLFIIIENRNRRRRPSIKDLSQLDYRTALFIGFFQVLALIPGTSRSGATIVGAILIGTSRPVAAEFSFFLAIPVMFGASLLKLVHFGFHFTGMEAAVLLTGIVVAFVVSLFSIRFLMNYVKKHNFKIFGWYRILLGAIVILYFLLSSHL